jgi:glyoxylase-like metal-dependent hydrolase (beta-lactamase superfamily II)
MFLRHPLLAFFVSAAILSAQGQSPILPEQATKVSDHVHAIIGFPNVAIVVGDRATLVVDTGMGPRNGATITRVAQKLAKGPLMYLTTTHFHPEHSAGEPGFPPQTILIRNTVQQEEMAKTGQQMIDLFSSRSAENKALLEGVKLRQPDILFEKEMTLDLGGGVTARLMWLGPGHTRGDLMVFVQPDAALISGDIVEKRLVPGTPNENSTVKGWLELLDKVEPLKPRYVVPDHGELGDGSLIQSERAFLTDLRDAAVALKKQGVSLEDAGKRVTETLKAKYPDWPNLGGVPNVVRRVYAEY